MDPAGLPRAPLALAPLQSLPAERHGAEHAGRRGTRFREPFQGGACLCERGPLRRVHVRAVGRISAQRPQSGLALDREVSAGLPARRPPRSHRRERDDEGAPPVGPAMLRVSHLSIRAKVLFIVAGTLVVANLASTMVVRDLVYKYAVGQKLATADILASSFVHDLKYVLDVHQEGSTQDIIAKYMSYYRNIREIAFFDASRRDVADSDPARIGSTTQDVDVIAALTAARPSARTTRVGQQDFSI